MHEAITNNSLFGYCQERFCGKKATHSGIKVVAGMEMVLCFCKEHAEQFTDWFTWAKVDKECKNKKIVQQTKHEFELERFFERLEQGGYDTMHDVCNITNKKEGVDV